MNEPTERRRSPFGEEPSVTAQRHDSNQDRYPTLQEALSERNRALAERLNDFNVIIPVQECEEIITTLMEVVGHMSEDVGEQGYEFRLFQRVRKHARGLQAALLASLLPIAGETHSAAEDAMEHDEAPTEGSN
jgi:hypothetical protein